MITPPACAGGVFLWEVSILNSYGFLTEIWAESTVQFETKLAQTMYNIVGMGNKKSQAGLTGWSYQLLKATNEAAAYLTQSARSETAVFRAYEEQMAALKLRGGLSFLNEAGDTLTVRVVNYRGRIGKLLRQLEERFSAKSENFTFRVDSVDVYQRVIKTKETQFVPDTSQVIVQMVPPRIAPYINRIILVFGMHPGIYAPLIFPDGRVRGVMNIVDPQLTPEDMPALTAFANHIAVALENARLFEKLRGYTDELEIRVQERTQELAEANKRLMELDRLKSKLVSNVSHELRTPITNLELYLDLIKHGDHEKKDHYLSVIADQSHRLKQLVEGILDLSRLEAASGSEHWELIELNNVVEQVVQAQKERAAVKGLTLCFNPDPALPKIEGIASQLAQVVVNLVINSINHTQSGGIEVRTIIQNGNESVCLQVKDTGSGIHPHDQPFIFDRFYRGEDSGQANVPGTGLGLAIVKEIITIHQGQIKFDTQLGKGTTFWVWLPLNQRKQ